MGDFWIDCCVLFFSHAQPDKLIPSAKTVRKVLFMYCLVYVSSSINEACEPTTLKSCHPPIEVCCVVQCCVLLSRGVKKGPRGSQAQNIWKIESKCIFYNQGLHQLFLTVSWDLCSPGSKAWGQTRALKGRRISSKSPSRVWDGDEEVAGRNYRE